MCIKNLNIYRNKACFSVGHNWSKEEAEQGKGKLEKGTNIGRTLSDLETDHSQPPIRNDSF